MDEHSEVNSNGTENDNENNRSNKKETESTKVESPRMLYRQRSVDDNKDNPDSELLFESPDSKEDAIEKTKNTKMLNSILKTDL